MLVSRHPDTESSHWPFNKLDSPAHKHPITPPRMSSHFDTQLSSQTDWQGHYPCLAPDASGFSQSYGSGNEASDSSRPRSTTDSHGQPETESTTGDSTHLTSHPSLDTLDSSRTKNSSQTGDHPSQNQADADTAGSVAFSNDGSSPPSHRRQAVTMSPELMDAKAGSEGASAIKEEDDDLLDDDDVDLDGETTGRPMTAAERTAQRRKMKRFRLTHQQTRFLMSEFAKQPHPDAAHRERLSREIPGLSPRQVQVWFQNRRAKIKRLTADDRDRMIKMRAVPDDFDNVQALHSPYGAVHGLGTPMASPVDFGNSSYAEHMMRPLVIDVRRADGESHMSPTGLSPAFGNIGFNPSASMSNPDLLTPMSPSPGDHRYGYGSHVPSALSPGPRPTHTFGRQATLDNSMLQSRHMNRPLQPLHLRDSIRSRSDNLHSPLRTGMSWKGDSIDYTTYPGGNTSPQMTGRQQSMYQPDSLGTGPSSSGLEYESSHSMNYPNYQPSSLQPTTQSRLRNRAASATLPLGLDLRNQYRSSHSTLSSSSHATGASREASSSTASQFTGTTTTTFSSSFPSAPLTAPIDFTMPRTPASATQSGRPGVQDFSMPQMSAPIAPPNDFAHAFDARTPMRDTFASGDNNGMDHHRSGNAFGGDFSGSSALKRKRSFTVPGTTPSPAAGASVYGHQG